MEVNLLGTTQENYVPVILLVLWDELGVDLTTNNHTRTGRSNIMVEAYVDSTPYKWPFNGDLTPQNTCIIVIVSAPPRPVCLLITPI